MDIDTLIKDSKSRFNHNSAKLYLKEKYNAKLLVADQGGLWKADIQTITFLQNLIGTTSTTVMVDTFGNPILIDAGKLYEKLMSTYDAVMLDWHDEWKELENKR